MSGAPSPSALAAALAEVRPLILGHGGDIVLDPVGEDGVVHVRLSGACKACPNMAMTYVGPIRTRLMQVEGVAEVRCAQVKAAPRALARMAALLGARPFGAEADLAALGPAGLLGAGKALQHDDGRRATLTASASSPKPERQFS